jgi:outer membrane protein assembly factor BamA
MPATNPLRSLPTVADDAWRRRRKWVLGWLVVLSTTTTFAQNTAPPPATADPVVAVATPPAAAAQEPHTSRKFIDAMQEWAKKHQILERLSGDVDGWYPRLGGMTRGSGFAIGPGYRTHVMGSDVLVDVSAAMTFRLYKAVDFKVRWLQAWNDRAEVWTDYRFEDYPQEDFYGIGPDTRESTRVSYRIRGSDFRVRGLVKPLRWLRTGVNVGYLLPSVGAGRDSRFPSIEEIFDDIAAPGLITQPDFLHTELFAEINYLDAPGNPRRGGFYRATFENWNDRTLDAYHFRRFDGGASQFVPISPDRKHTVSGHLGVSYVNNAPGDRVPFYALPYVGGTDTVRSYHEFRFQDENALWFNAEYIWTPIKWVSGAVFADFGKVAADWEDINVTDLKRGYGFGVRVHSTKQTFAKVDFGFGGGEGRRIFIKLGPSF